jgi:hypothetical protein
VPACPATPCPATPTQQAKKVYEKEKAAYEAKKK